MVDEGKSRYSGGKEFLIDPDEPVREGFTLR